MEKNGRQYVQDCCAALHDAVSNLQLALQTVEKDYNRENIEASLQLVENALHKCDHTAEQLLEH